MKIAIGSTNRVKIQALEEVLKDYPKFIEAKIIPFSVPSGVSDQPHSIAEMITGAKNRAKNAFDACGSCVYSFGMESGLFEAPGTQTGFIEACICSLYNGESYAIGLSSGFEVPPQILKFVLEEKVDLNEACQRSGFTTNKKLGEGDGLIGMLTNGRLRRKEYTKQSVITALIQHENSKWYKPPLAP